MKNVKAFPHEEIIENDLNTKVGGIQKMPTIIRHPGMDLRDYFAAKAMQAMVTGQDWFNSDWNLEAEAAYQIADEMMKARLKCENSR